MDEESVQGLTGSLAQSLLQSWKQRSARTTTQLKAQTGGFVPKTIYMIIDRLQFLLGLIGSEGIQFLLSVDQRPPSVPCHISLSVGQFTTWSWLLPEQVNNKRRESKTEITIFVT